VLLTFTDYQFFSAAISTNTHVCYDPLQKQKKMEKNNFLGLVKKGSDVLT